MFENTSIYYYSSTPLITIVHLWLHVWYDKAINRVFVSKVLYESIYSKHYSYWHMQGI